MQFLQSVQIHASEIALGAGLFVSSLFLSVAAAVFVIVRLPAHYFHVKDPEPFWADRPAWQRHLGRIGKNVLGAILVVLGVIMSLPGVPGQGLLTIFIGLVLLDLPGKRALERRFIRVPAILNACNRLRARFEKPPITLDEMEQAQKIEIGPPSTPRGQG